MADQRFEELLARLRVWGEMEDDVRGIILFGSRARASRPADRWSDVDLLVSCRDPGALLGSTEWLEALGEVRISFLETNPVDREQERRVLFASGLDVDFNFVQARRLRLLRFALGPARMLVPPAQRRDARAGAQALATIMRPGSRILLDKDGVLERVTELSLRQPLPPPRERPLDEIASDFWYHAVWTAKKLRRGELWMAKGCCDAYLKDRIAEVLSLGRERPDGLSTPRFIDQALDDATAKLLRESHGRYDRADLARALTVTLDLFSQVARQTCARLNLIFDESEERFARAQVAHVLAETEDS
ncbi:MAG: aminoglycoside 6-adenylyltransferase [Gaiellaceae bacterium]|jgi:aminoglycoside 6-adenylyltransferase